jgi:hypothetical protein
VREELLAKQFTMLLGRLHFDDEVLAWVREAMHASHGDERREHEEAIRRLQGEHRQLGGRINAMYVDKLDGRVDGAFFDKMSAAQHSSSISSFELGQVRMITYATADEAQHALARQHRVQEAPGVLHQIRQWLDVAA